MTSERVGGWGSEELNWVRATDDPNPDAVCMEIAAGEGDLVHIRQSDAPEHVVTTTQAKWDAFVQGVRNREFDHFVAGHAAERASDHVE